MGAVAFVADRHPAVAGQPRQGAFDLPPVSTQALAGLDPAAGDARHDAPLAQPPAVHGGVVAVVRPQPPGVRRRGPRRDRTAGIAATIDCSMTLSWVFAEVARLVVGTPDA